jgi:hypothetical protein
MAALSPAPLIVKVEAPWRISMYGHSTSGVAPATGCGALSEDAEKKSPISPLSHPGPEDDDAAAGAGAGAAVLLNRLPPLQPETASAKTSAPAGAARPQQRRES